MLKQNISKLDNMAGNGDKPPMPPKPKRRKSKKIK